MSRILLLFPHAQRPHPLGGQLDLGTYFCFFGRWQLTAVLGSVLSSVLIAIQKGFIEVGTDSKIQRKYAKPPHFTCPHGVKHDQSRFTSKSFIFNSLSIFIPKASCKGHNNQLPKPQIQMNAEYYAIIEEQLQSLSTEFTAEQNKGLPSKKKNYEGLQDDSRKKSKKKHWKPQENKRYVNFLRDNMELFEKNREDKRLMKINILMSEYVKSKTSTQCRSHHQKMLAHYKTIQNIIHFLCADEEQGKVELKVEQESVPVCESEAEENGMEEMEEVEESPKVTFQKDIFEVLSTNCWGYVEDPSFF